MQARQVKHHALAIFQGWHQQVQLQLEAAAVLLHCCLETWACAARRSALHKFLLMEQAAIWQVIWIAVAEVGLLVFSYMLTVFGAL